MGFTKSRSNLLFWDQILLTEDQILGDRDWTY